jgi:hypothetical protein
VKARTIVFGRAFGAKPAARLFEPHDPERFDQVARRFVFGHLARAQHLVLVGQQRAEHGPPGRIGGLAEFHQPVAAVAPLDQERLDQRAGEGVGHDIQRQVALDQVEHRAVVLVLNQEFAQQKFGSRGRVGRRRDVERSVVINVQRLKVVRLNRVVGG